jgi:cellulose synthase/poly-beta-1,6-N-acetylglucosamine synthase-like glycosyltransferase
MLLAISVVYFLAATWLALYGFNALWLVFRYLRTRHRRIVAPALVEFPMVTVQLPIYNEVHVIPRLLDAVTKLDYPRDRLQIQVLDDSTDSSTEILQELVQAYEAQGIDICLIHRDRRSGYKAGALAEGLAQAKGQFLAVFDADFLPEPDWLVRTVPYVLTQPDAGFVQTRWSHLNAQYSPITMAQAIILDAHFLVEHSARNRSGCFINFNGTAGLWRKECITRSGGWCGDTLTEDLDLSYRAQIAGWRAVFLPNVEVSSELPPQVVAFKLQQFRWAKGSAQCLRRLARPLLHAGVSWRAKVEAFLHLSGYCAFPLMLIIFLLTLPLMWWGDAAKIPLMHLSIASLGPPLSWVVAQIALHRGHGRTQPWWKRVAYVPFVLLLGCGIAASNARAVLEGFLGVKVDTFTRTPKFNMAYRGDRWRGKSYSMELPRDILVDIVFALYAFASIVAAIVRDAFWYLPLLALYAIGFSLVIAISLWQSRQLRPSSRERRPPQLKQSQSTLNQ